VTGSDEVMRRRFGSLGLPVSNFFSWLFSRCRGIFSVVGPCVVPLGGLLLLVRLGIFLFSFFMSFRGVERLTVCCVFRFSSREGNFGPSSTLFSYLSFQGDLRVEQSHPVQGALTAQLAPPLLDICTVPDRCLPDLDRSGCEISGGSLFLK